MAAHATEPPERGAGPPSERSSKHSRSLPAAIASALVLIGLIVACYNLGVVWFFMLASAVVMIALFEMLDSLVHTGRRICIPLGLAGGFALMLLTYLGYTSWTGAVVAVTTMLAFGWALRPGRGLHPGADAGWTVLSVAWIGGGGAAAAYLLTLEGAGGGMRFLIAGVLMTSLFDIFAYYAGTYFGRHKLAPTISPGKSWEGVAGGVLGGIAGGILLGSLFAHLSVVDGIAVGLITSVFAPVGDLTESMIKRELGIKDSGRLLPGHGGMLDRLDAIVFVLPPLAAYVAFVAL
jgi:phosphatidate cytidylyltransferase